MVGGKAAQLGELSRVEGLAVPPGFCITTEAFRRCVGEAPWFVAAKARLARLGSVERSAARAISEEIALRIGAAPIPEEIALAITDALEALGPTGVAVRSSATAEDQPAASYAGQFESALNVIGAAAVLAYTRRCWASLYAPRALSYQAGPAPWEMEMAVVVQQLVVAEAAGVLFTADPSSGHRKISCIEACFGLGEALVAGQVNADVYRVQEGAIIAKAIAAKQQLVEPDPAGGTQRRAVPTERQTQPALTDQEVLELEALGRRVEAHLGSPQDVEWCLADRRLYLVQSRPITTLFPIPEAPDTGPRVYVSVGHQQMMTDAMKPLGLSLFRATSPAPMREAGGRLFVDVTAALASPSRRPGLLAAFGRSDVLLRDALETLVAREFIRTAPEEPPAGPAPPPPAEIEASSEVVERLIARAEASLTTLERDLLGYSGAELVEFIRGDIAAFRRILFDPLSHQVLMAGMEAAWWLNEQLDIWLGQKNAADLLGQGLAANITSEMGRDLLDVADVIRPHLEVVRFLSEVSGDDFLDQLGPLAGGPASKAAIVRYLAKHGRRCVGEIDVTRPRFVERPSTLLPLLLGTIQGAEQGAGAKEVEGRRARSQAYAEDVLARLKALPDGDEKAAQTRRMIERLRAFSGYREYPKYAMICRYFAYKQALRGAAKRLVEAGVLKAAEDIDYLTLEELQEVLRSQRADEQLLHRQKEAHRAHQRRSPPRVLTSDGEGLNGNYRRGGLPSGALAGLAASAGIVQGRARVLLDPAQAALEAGDILVTTYTDPSWTPVFVRLQGLVTEVGGLMTHGTVIARELGLPAVVAVAEATSRIRDGQQIRVNGTEGYVEILS